MIKIFLKFVYQFNLINRIRLGSIVLYVAHVAGQWLKVTLKEIMRAKLFKDS